MQLTEINGSKHKKVKAKFEQNYRGQRFSTKHFNNQIEHGK